MNQAAKVLIIFVTIASLSFMALTGAVTLGGPNWWGRTQEMTEYTFDKTTGETTSYSASHRPSGQPVQSASSPILAKTVVAVQQDEKTRQEAILTKLNEDIAREEARIKILKDLQAGDRELLEARSNEYLKQLDAINAAVATLTEDIDKLTQETFALDESLGERREDVLRLRDQLALVRTDRERLIAERGELEDILVLLKSSLEQLDRRTKQLQTQTN